jgi:hypothetical protein
MKTLFILLLLVVATGVIYTQNALEISYNWDKENHICVSADPLNLTTIIDGEWSGPGIVENVFYPQTVPPGSTINLICNGKEFTMIVHPLPYVSFGWMPKEIKLGSGPIQLTGYPADGKWVINGVPFYGNFSTKEVGTYEVMYILTDKYGCTSGVVEKIVVK